MLTAGGYDAVFAIVVGADAVEGVKRAWERYVLDSDMMQCLTQRKVCALKGMCFQWQGFKRTHRVSEQMPCMQEIECLPNHSCLTNVCSCHLHGSHHPMSLASVSTAIIDLSIIVLTVLWPCLGCVIQCLFKCALVAS